MIGTAVLAALETGAVVLGRHVLVIAHPDDETISCAAALSRLADVALVQLTTGNASTDPNVIAARRAERVAAFTAAEWPWPVTECAVLGRSAHLHIRTLLEVVAIAIEGADAVWTHPYEGGHLDHDTAAWLVQTACAACATPPMRMEFASYHAADAKRSVFGAFWPDPTVASVTVPLTPDVLARKRAALAAYASQAHILRKFPTLEVEAYRVAPMYDFTQPAAPPSRWDLKGYTPTSAAWRTAVAAASLEIEVSA